MNLACNIASPARRAHRGRRGSAMVEVAIMLPILLLLIFGMFDLGLAVFHNNLTAHVARRIARVVSVHGQMASPQLTRWGPSAYSSTADAAGDIPDTIRPCLTGLDPAQTIVTLEWPDGNNTPESRVRVTVATAYTPFMSALFGNGAWTLTGSTTVQINH